MAEMNNKQRASLYAERLMKASNKQAEAENIVNEINQLYWVKNSNPLTKDEKLALIKDIEELISKKSKVSQEHYKEKREGLESLEEGFVVNASDNSDLIDLIVAMKGRVK